MIKFQYGESSAYNLLPSKDSDTLYFLSDTRQIYRGEELFSQVAVEFAAAKPEFASATEDTLYIIMSEDIVTLYVKGTSDMVEVAGGLKPGSITNIDVFSSDILDTKSDGLSDTDTNIPTSGAVKAAIESAVSEIDLTPYDEAFTGVSASANDAPGETGTILTFTRKSGASPVEVKIADLFLSAASYDPETHKLTLTVSGAEIPVEVDLSELVPQAITTSEVAMADTITVTTPVGNFTKGQVVDVADLQTFLVSMLSQDSNPQTTQPSASITLSGAGAKEVGTEFTPSYNASLNPGSYSDNKDGAQPTGVTATSWAVTDTNDGSSDTQTGSFTKFTVEDSTNYKVSVTVNYGDGNVPTTFLGKPYPDGQIKARSKTASSTAVTGFRNCWWGAKQSSNLIADPTSITSEQIKALGNSNRNKPTSLTASDMQQMFFAVPASQATSLSIVGTNSPLPQTVQGPVTVKVGGVNDHAPIDYKVFYVSNAAPASGSETYKLTWK